VIILGAGSIVYSCCEDGWIVVLWFGRSGFSLERLDEYCRRLRRCVGVFVCWETIFLVSDFIQVSSNLSTN
jgi:hypothetical protein